MSILRYSEPIALGDLTDKTQAEQICEQAELRVFLSRFVDAPKDITLEDATQTLINRERTRRGECDKVPSFLDGMTDL